MYARADAGEIADVPGVSAPYERPADPDLALDTSTVGVDASVDAIMTVVESRLR
jgi:bifunctional enzyme CysN/CysC